MLIFIFVYTSPTVILNMIHFLINLRKILKIKRLIMNIQAPLDYDRKRCHQAHLINTAR